MPGLEDVKADDGDMETGDVSTVTAQTKADNKDQILHLKSEEDLKVGRRRVAKGTYEVGFAVTDFAGNTTEKYTSVKIE